MVRDLDELAEALTVDLGKYEQALESAFLVTQIRAAEFEVDFIKRQHDGFERRRNGRQ